MATYTREFTAYCTAHGRAPADQLAHDVKRWPGGKMAGFILWMADALRDFKAAHPEACVGDMVRDHDAKAAFLEARALKQAAA